MAAQQQSIGPYLTQPPINLIICENMNMRSLRTSGRYCQFKQPHPLCPLELLAAPRNCVYAPCSAISDILGSSTIPVCRHHTSCLRSLHRSGHMQSFVHHANTPLQHASRSPGTEDYRHKARSFCWSITLQCAPFVGLGGGDSEGAGWFAVALGDSTG